MDALRTKYPVFIYESFNIQRTGEALILTFQYSIGSDLRFEHTVHFKGVSNEVDDQVLKPYAFHIGLAEMFSYWKLTSSPQIQIRAGALNEEQIVWWQKLLIEGMGEYFYKNQIDFTAPDFVTITAEGESYDIPHIPKNQSNESQVLVPLGGGKDSIVTLELLKKANVPVTPLIVFPTTPSSSRIVERSGLADLIIVDRIIDPYLIELSKSGKYLNGHIPYSAALAFIFLFAATAQDIPYIAVSNERSSEEGNVMYHGKVINHQYSKTLAFEKDFQAYIYTWLASPVHFFSFLRPLSELQIGKLFSSMSEYFSIFRSCNRNQKQDSWCGMCPKCISVALSIAPWTGMEAIEKIIGSNPLTNPENSDLIKNMTDPQQVKPFECIVGTHEAQMCLEFLEKGKTSAVESFLKEWGDDSNIPPHFLHILKTAYENT